MANLLGGGYAPAAITAAAEPPASGCHEEAGRARSAPRGGDFPVAFLDILP
ncbi:MAG TPA: hypothetical protein VKK31_02565 [Thermoanaerobaculia bacterium]|nr:hypothetical protein [Thermoanaerobaculia bacterium]